MADTIHFILTGGTIDSFYDGAKDSVVPLPKSSLPGFVKLLKLYDKLVFTEICMKDSRAIADSDRKKIIVAIEKSISPYVIITHGTYTMPDTARYIKANLKRKDVTIILTGSMIPLTGFSPSDAAFNLGYSVAKVKEVKRGIYVCMNGTLFSSEEVVKQLNEGRFVSVFGEGK